MSLKIVKSWYENLPPAERDLPLIILNNKAYSPDEVLQEVRNGTSLGEQLQDRVERRDWGTPLSTKEQLAKERLKKILEKRPVDIVALVRPSESPDKAAEQLKHDIEEERTDFAKKMISQETEYLERVRSK